MPSRCARLLKDICCSTLTWRLRELAEESTVHQILNVFAFVLGSSSGVYLVADCVAALTTESLRVYRLVATA